MTKIPEEMIELFLEKWYPVEWPDHLELPGGREVDEMFKARSRKKCREALEAAGVGELIRDAARYRWLRERDLESLLEGGIFIGKTPNDIVLNLDDADRAIDAERAKATGAAP